MCIRDRSTGLCQIFASTAIKAYNEAIELGYIFGSKIDITDWKQCRDVWFSLKNNNEYNINMATLNILSCINEYCYSFDFGNYTPSMYKQVFTRYNADMNTINDYGQECYKYFLILDVYKRQDKIKEKYPDAYNFLMSLRDKQPHIKNYY